MEDWSKDGFPLVVTYVELDEGPRMMTNLVNCNPADVKVDAPVTTGFVSTEREDVEVPRLPVGLIGARVFADRPYPVMTDYFDIYPVCPNCL